MNQGRIREVVAREFILDRHMAALEEAAFKGNFAVTFRAAGPATLRALARGAGAKGHDVLEKTIKEATIMRAYPDRGKQVLAELREAGIEGGVGHWDPLTGELVGLYLCDRNATGSHEILPLDLSHLETSLATLKTREHWQRHMLSGDYDMHDLILFGLAGRPRRSMASRKEEIDAIRLMNAAIAKVDKARPLDDPTHQVIQHGPQVNYPDYMRFSERETLRAEGGLQDAVAMPGKFPIAALHGGVWNLLQNIEQLDDFYARHGATLKESWRPGGVRQFQPVAGHPGKVMLGWRRSSEPEVKAATASRDAEAPGLPLRGRRLSHWY
ncbi:Insecticial toxin [Roseateles sp. YR242]|uniref:Insecticial toxin n=1 Tax=Roseateles sp. YR242 TaxID=1855305 RepID=UPI0011602BB8|nr:Insecticial toxin [Roseateles sp. YR242]